MISDFEDELSRAFDYALVQIRLEDATRLALACMTMDEAEFMEAYYGSNFGKLLDEKRRQEARMPVSAFPRTEPAGPGGIPYAPGDRVCWGGR